MLLIWGYMEMLAIINWCGVTGCGTSGFGESTDGRGTSVALIAFGGLLLATPIASIPWGPGPRVRLTTAGVVWVLSAAAPALMVSIFVAGN
jgi:hypothetical protein